MRKMILCLSLLFALRQETTAQLQTIESKRNFWTGTRYYMGSERLRVPEVQLHLDKNAPEAGKAFQRGKAPATWGYIFIGAANATAIYTLVNIKNLDSGTRNALSWTTFSLAMTSGWVFINTSNKRRQKALDTYNGMVRQ